jgi:NADH-ubiquinone oxidoreductase chain 2
MSPLIPATLLLYISLIVGTILSLSSTQWIIIWVGIEVNLISFIPLITLTNNFQETEAAIKYFTAQAIGSIIILYGGIIITRDYLEPGEYKYIRLLTLIGLITKLGIAPTHTWFPPTIASISWASCIILTTWQKIGPIIIIGQTLSLHPPQIIHAVISIGALTGGIMGLFQTQLRPLLAYSSIGHIAWILAAAIIRNNTIIIYISTYIIISLTLFSLLIKRNLKSRSIPIIAKQNIIIIIGVLRIILSLGGLPPFLGFIPKWWTLQEIIKISPYIITIIFILTGSLINLFYYISIIINITMLAPPYHPLYRPYKIITASIVIISLFTIPALPLIITFI